MPTWASSTPSHPVFAATEDTPSEEVINSAPGASGAPIENNVIPTPVMQVNLSHGPAPTTYPLARKQTRVQKKKIARANARKVKVAAKAAAKPNRKSKAQYDVVPSSQTEPLAKRLKIVEELLTRYGRAYDYRELTLAELENILVKLNEESAETREVQQRMSLRSEERQELGTTAARTEPVDAFANDVALPPPPTSAGVPAGNPLPVRAAGESRNSIGSQAPETSPSAL